VVYENLLVGSSKFFENALKGPWKESTDRVISIPAFLDALYFEIYHQWLLKGNLHSKPAAADVTKRIELFRSEGNRLKSGSVPSIGVIDELITLKYLASLGHYLLATDFMDTVDDAITQCVQELKLRGCEAGALGLWSDYYKLIPPGSHTRALLTDLTAYTLKNKLDVYFGRLEKGVLRNPHPDFIFDVLKAVTRRDLASASSVSPLDGWKTSCKYHSHGEDKPCYREKAKKYVGLCIVMGEL
jgi:hypothetical protein